jgi:hypothetical protein
MTGPFETEDQARLLPEVREVYAAFRADPGLGKMTPHNQKMLLDALAGAGVYLGAYDHRIAEWLANWEPQTVAVIAGWVQRASEARQVGDQAAARADQLLAKMRDGPPGPCPPGDRQKPQTSPRLNASTGSVDRGGDSSRAPREVTP